jgi:hypothetical protein
MKFKPYQYIVLLFTLMLASLVITNPTEEDYFNRIVKDYAQNHAGFIITKVDLANMGQTQYKSNFIYSTYSYQFGNIKVVYWGILGSIFYSGFEKDEAYLDSSKTISV